MSSVRLKLFIVLFFSCLAGQLALGQGAAKTLNFLEYQRGFPRINDALKRKGDALAKSFREKNMDWPVRQIYIRSFKFDSELEVWVRYDTKERFVHFKTYRICALAGTLGPKRMQGDYQVPEGFYYINEFNPNSSFHLSLGLNYPNASDRILADSLMPGGDIYIHGKCVTTGCIPILDQQIEELYILAAHAKNQGQDFIPVHIYPVRFSNPKSAEYLARHVRQFPEYASFCNELKQAYEYFEKHRKPPTILIGPKGEYMIAQNVQADEKMPAAPR